MGPSLTSTACRAAGTHGRLSSPRDYTPRPGGHRCRMKNEPISQLAQKPITTASGWAASPARQILQGRRAGGGRAQGAPPEGDGLRAQGWLASTSAPALQHLPPWLPRLPSPRLAWDSMGIHVTAAGTGDSQEQGDALVVKARTQGQALARRRGRVATDPSLGKGTKPGSAGWECHEVGGQGMHTAVPRPCTRDGAFTGAG